MPANKAHSMASLDLNFRLFLKNLLLHKDAVKYITKHGGWVGNSID